MRAVFIGPPSHAEPGREPTHWVAVADYLANAEAIDDVPEGPATKGLGEYPLIDAREIASEEAQRTGLRVIDLTRKAHSVRT
jgi:hypothetical protein